MSTVLATERRGSGRAPLPLAPRLRLAMVMTWLVVFVLLALLGQRAATLEDLLDAVDSGQVATVRVNGMLEPGASGWATQDVRWRSGLWQRHAEVVHASEDSVLEARSASNRSVTSTDVATLIENVDPRVRVVVSEDDWRTTGSVLAWETPFWLVWCVLAGLGVTLALIGYGPEPWRATRWAWAWMVLFTGPFGALAFAILSGPAPVIPAPTKNGRRLSGGWAFLLLLLGSAWIGAQWN